jgi:hypothetical protein
VGRVSPADEGRPGRGSVGVCTETEWAAMDRAAPGLLTLVRAGIPNEGEAERVARQTAAAVPSQAAQGKRPPRAALDQREPSEE